MERRSFLGKLIGWILGITTMSFLAPVVSFLWPKKEERTQNVFTDANGNPIPASQIEEGSFKLGLSRDGPTLVLKREGQFFAFSAVCTHLGCIVQWKPEEGIFFCPCHAGKFDANGVNIAGPPPRPLTRYSVTITKDDLLLLTEERV
jgi:cytochrome b6-f complex iron-sulfur subunit